MMGPTRRPIRYLSGLSPIHALSLSCLINVFRFWHRCTNGTYVSMLDNHAHVYTRCTRVCGVSTIRRISVRERPVLITSRGTAVRKGLRFSDLILPSLLPRSMEEETRVWEFRVRSLGRSYRDCKSLSHSLNPPLDYSEREPAYRTIERVYIYTYTKPSKFFFAFSSSGGRGRLAEERTTEEERAKCFRASLSN